MLGLNNDEGGRKMGDRNSPLISVIIPAYNAEKTISQAIDSVLSQTFQNVELIIINDCSEDNTLAISEVYASSDSRVNVISNPQNLGVSTTRMKGVQASRGQWLAFLDSDDVWNLKKLEKQFKLQTETGAKLLFTGSAFIDAEGNSIDWYLHVPKKIGYRQLLKQNLVSNSSVLIWKEAYLESVVEGDDMHEDFACWLNYLKKGNLAYGIDEPLLIYRLSPTSKSGNKLKAAQMNWNAYRAIGLNVFEAFYYEAWYVVRGLMKYKNLR